MESVCASNLLSTALSTLPYLRVNFTHTPLPHTARSANIALPNNRVSPTLKGRVGFAETAVPRLVSPTYYLSPLLTAFPIICLDLCRLRTIFST